MGKEGGPPSDYIGLPNKKLLRGKQQEKIIVNREQLKTGEYEKDASKINMRKKGIKVLSQSKMPEGLTSKGILGRGAMGEVHKVEKDGKTFALKIFTRTTEDGESIDIFLFRTYFQIISSILLLLS